MIRTQALWVLAVAGAGTTAITALAATEAPRPAASAPAAAAAPISDARALEFFESKIRPLLAEKCFACHTGAKAQGQLDLRSRAAILKGGVLGTALKPGDPDGSLLIQVVRYQHSIKMPPQGKMPAEQIQLLEEWVRMGAPWPEVKGAAGSAPAGKTLSPEEKIRRAAQHWSFQPVRSVKVPPVKTPGWVRTPIDSFILAGLEKQGLKPNPYADRRTLIRRATFDLIGLPPTPEEIQAFVNDRSPNAWEKVVDRLLASPQYGERWGRHWLDVMRYSDSNGLDWNEVYAHAHRYRDYVIKSFNTDKPYDQFIREQIAGDLLPAKTTEQSYEQITATGMLVMGPKLLAQQDRLKLTMDVIDEQIDVVSKGFMGLTVSCARCHDHKFDPVPTKDYYALAGIFKSTMTMNGTLTRNGRVWYWNERPLADPDTVKSWKTHDTAVKAMQDRIKKCKDAEEKKLLNEELKKLQTSGPPTPPLAMAVQEGKLENVRIHLRGNPKTLGEEVPRGLPAVLARQTNAAVTGAQSGRLELANWIASPTHPLTGRVLVNRVWQGHFGTGIVATPDNFGLLGEKPTHPELLDYLATLFTSPTGNGTGSTNVALGSRGAEGQRGLGTLLTVATTGLHGSAPKAQRPAPDASPQGLGWSIKKLHRLILLSAAYQMSSDPTPQSYAKDPDNRLVWRMSPRRLEAEAIRDAVLAVNDQLDRTAGGSLLPKAVGLAGNDVKVDFNGSRRRSVYLPVVRGGVYDVLQAFDFPDPQVVNGRRAVTTVSAQALVMLNSPFVVEQSEKMAGLVLNAPNLDDAQRVELAYQRALGRSPSSLENRRTLQYLENTMKALEATVSDPEKRRVEAWRTFCQALYASTEFRYVN